MATILLVDDDADFRAALARVLLQDGHRTRLAPGCVTALELTTASDPVELVIADVELCGESGLELLRELRRRNPGLPLILVSAAPDAATYLEALRLGVFEYLPKPLEFAELRQVVARALSPAGARSP